MRINEQADIFSCSASSIKKWALEGYPIKGSLKEQIAWVRTNKPLMDDRTLTNARREKIEIETELKKIQLLIQKGELVQRAEALQEFLWAAGIFKTTLLTWNRTLAPELAHKDAMTVAAILKHESSRLFDRISNPKGVFKNGKKIRK